MPELNTFACEICGALRRDVNRWWMLWSVGKRIFCSEFNTRRWGQLMRLGIRRAVACGEEHAQQLFGRWLVSGSFDAPSQRPIAREPVVGAPLAAPDPSVPTREEDPHE